MDLIATAKTQIAEHEAKIARLREFISMHRELEREMATTVNITPNIRMRVIPSKLTASPAKDSSPAKDIIAAAKVVLKDAGKPMTRFELVPAIEARGLKIGGKDKARNLGTILWRSVEIESTGDGYWLKGVPIQLKIKPGDVAEDRRRDV